MTDFPEMTADEMRRYADRLDSEIPSMNEIDAMINWNAALGLRAKADEMELQS